MSDCGVHIRDGLCYCIRTTGHPLNEGHVCECGAAVLNGHVTTVRELITT